MLAVFFKATNENTKSTRHTLHKISDTAAYERYSTVCLLCESSGCSRSVEATRASTHRHDEITRSMTCVPHTTVHHYDCMGEVEG